VGRSFMGRAGGLFLVPAMWLLSVGGLSAEKSAFAKPEKDTCHGTSIRFEDTPSAAARKAAKEQKLVFVLHVSGHFEDPRFT
jgi:hypothetical protein